MSGFLWVMLDEAGAERSRSEGFDSQAEAEAWLSSTWPSLADEGTATVRLVEGSRIVYEMGLGEA